jgi:hypothetical protein
MNAEEKNQETWIKNRDFKSVVDFIIQTSVFASVYP